MTTETYTVIAPMTPGATPTVYATTQTLREARAAAAAFAQQRRDLTYQDVRIERAGTRVEYAGPAR